MTILFAMPIEQWPDFLAFATVPTVSPAAETGFPASNLLTYDPTQTFVSSTGSSTITWDFGSTRDFDVVSVAHTNSTMNCTLIIQGSANGSAWTTLKASGPLWAHLSVVPGAGPFTEALDPRRHALKRNLSFWYSTSVQQWRYIRVTIADPVVSKLSIGRLFVGRSFVPSRGYQYGSNLSFVSVGRRERTDKGTLIIEHVDAIISASLKTEFLTKQEMYDWTFEFNYWRGSTREMLVCLDVDDVLYRQKNTLYCTMTESRTISSDAFDLYSQIWNIESIA